MLLVELNYKGLFLSEVVFGSALETS